MPILDLLELSEIKDLLIEGKEVEALPKLYALAAAYPQNIELQNLIRQNDKAASKQPQLHPSITQVSQQNQILPAHSPAKPNQVQNPGSKQGLISREKLNRNRQRNSKLLEYLFSFLFFVVIASGVVLFLFSNGTLHTPGCDIKGNISYNSGAKIYHVSGQLDYDATVISTDKGERWFCSEQEAIQNGWHKATR
jgi:hypothetical protein